MGAQLTVPPWRSNMVQIVNTPAPHEYETKDAFCARFTTHATVMRHYPTPFKRHIAAETRWARAKSESLVSVKTDAGEMLLFGSL